MHAAQPSGARSDPGQAPPPARGWLTRGVAGVGAASFFSDAGHEITTSALPTFITVTLRSSAGALGLIEGVSDALTGVAKFLAGPLADEEGLRLRMACGGYVVTAAATGAIGLAGAVWQAGLLRASAWLARGVRSPARDAMLSSLSEPHSYGRAFGFERAGDNLGAVAGPLLGSGLIAWLGIRPALYLAAVPGVFAAVAIVVAVAQARGGARPAAPSRRRFELSALRQAGALGPLMPIAAFELGNMASTLLILRASSVLHAGGRSVAGATALAVLLYAGHNLFASVVAFLGGHWIDRAGARAAFVAAACLYAGAYALLAAGPSAWPLLAIAFVLGGSGIGLAETAEGALYARLLPEHLRGSGFGLLGGVQSLGDFASSALVGLLWSTVSPAAGFGYAGGCMTVAAVAAARPGLMGGP